MSKQIVFTRITHDLNGEFRKELYSKPDPFCKGLSVHGFPKSNVLTTFEKYKETHQNYEDQFEECPCPSDEELLEDLNKLIKLDLVKLEFDNE